MARVRAERSHACSDRAAHARPAGYALFQYVDERGETPRVDSADVNAYLKSIAREEFTSKDFRTWAGTVLAAEALHRLGKKGLSQAPPCHHRGARGRRPKPHSLVALLKKSLRRLRRRGGTQLAGTAAHPLPSRSVR